MKSLLLIICTVLFFSCKDSSNVEPAKKPVTESDKEITSLEGAWKLVSFLNYREDGTVDTILSSDTNKQVKMYSPTKVMWCRTRISDSIDWFGYGDYRVNDSVLTEVLEYGSKSMNEVIKEKMEFVFKVTIGKNEFSQIEIDSLGRPIFAENYIRIE